MSFNIIDRIWGYCLYTTHKDILQRFHYLLDIQIQNLTYNMFYIIEFIALFIIYLKHFC